MCGRYSLANADPDALRARFPLGESVEIRRRFNAAPGDEVLTVLGGDRAPTGALARWGWVPHWATDPRAGRRPINARAETIARTPAFRDAFARHRCLVIADGFYEWRATEAGKQPYWIARADGEPFAFAGLWSGWHDPADGPTLLTCAIVTTRANGVVAPIHDRMPVILARADEARWLDADAGRAALAGCLRPLPDADTYLRPVARAVNDARYDGPECLAPADEPPAPAGGEGAQPDAPAATAPTLF